MVISLKGLILRRIGVALPSIVLIITAVFLLIRLAPGDPVLYLAGETGASPEIIERLRIEFALDRPLHEQYTTYLTMVAQGNLGNSLIMQRSVTELIFDRLPSTLLLIALAELFSTLGVYLGVEAGWRLNSKIDYSLSILSIAGYSLPIFWLGQILLVIFSLKLGAFPMGGLFSLRQDLTGFWSVLDILWHAVLPVIALGLDHLNLVFRVTKASTVDITMENYVLSARAKGISTHRIKYAHVLRNALIPVITILGLNFGRVIGGAILTETVFSWPGLGRLFFLAVQQRDYPVVTGMFIFISVSVVLINLVTDILYAILDPRVRYE